MNYLLFSSILLLGSFLQPGTAESVTPDILEDRIQKGMLLSRHGKRDSSLQLLQRTFDAAKTYKNPGLIADARLALIQHFVHYQLRDSLSHHLPPLIKYTDTHNLLPQKIQAKLFLSGHLLETQRYSQALEIAEEGVALAMTIPDVALQGRAALYKAMCMRVVRDDSHYPLPYLYKALDMLEQAGDTSYIIKAALLVSAGENDEDKHKQILQKAESLVEKYKSPIARMNFLNFKASRMEPSEGLPLLEEAMQISKSLRIPNMIQHLYLQKSFRYLSLKQYNKAIANIDSARAAFPDNLPDGGALNYFEAYKAKGDYKKAISYMDQYLKFQDVRNRNDMKSLLAEWETTLETKEAQWELESQKDRNFYLASVLVLIFLVAILLVLAFFKQKKARRLLAQQNFTIRKQKEALQNLEQLKSRFFANVSHELRTPLSLIIGPVSSLLNKTNAQEEEHKMLQFIFRNARHLQNLVNELLDFARLENNIIKLSFEPMRLYDYLEEQIAQIQSAMDAKDLEFSFSYQGDKNLQIIMDRKKFEKILHNYLSNALKFTPPGGKVQLFVNDLDHEILLGVKDTGRGIPTEALEKIFDRFYQVQHLDRQEEGGTGIGLSMVKELGDLLKGKVWAKNNTDGPGSTFYFTFTKVIAEPAPIEPKSETLLPELLEAKDAQATTPKSTILIVEDNPDLRNYLTMVLSGHEVKTAGNGKEAMEILASNKFSPQLIVTDLMMPVMDGYELVKALKESDKFCFIPIIVLTAKSNIRDKIKALRIGVDDYILKPFQEEELCIRVKNILFNRRERQQFIEKEKLLAEKEGKDMALADLEWLSKVEETFLQNVSNEQFNITTASYSLHISERQLYRRLKSLTGLTPNQYFQEMRLQTAKDYLAEGRFKTLKETAFAVGYNSPSYFSRIFKQRFGIASLELLSN